MSVGHYENFPVASVLCPPALRPAVSALYHFARAADDIADEGDADPAARLADLAAYRADLEAILVGRDPGPRWRSVFDGLADAVREHRLPAEPLRDLLDAFEQDVHNPTYADRLELLAYCRRSANPIGRLLLHLYCLRDVQAEAQSDAVCTALQLINFWQDLSRDTPRGRHYVPLADLSAHGLTLADLRDARDGPAQRAMVATLCDWARALMLRGAPLTLLLPGRAGWELRFVVQGGLRILERIAAMDHATLQRRPQLGVRDFPIMLWRALRMGHGHGSR